MSVKRESGALPIPGAACRLPEHLADNPCPRCGADMIWAKASWHCLRCRYKEGCC